MSKREEIIDSAATIVHLKGFNNTSLDDILGQSHTGKGQFYHYFESKEELGFAIIDRQFELWKNHVLDKVFSEHRGLEAVDTFFRQTIAHTESAGSKGGCPFGNLAQELSDIHEGFRTKLQEIFGRIIGQFERAYDQAKEDGNIRRDVNSRNLAQFTLAALQGGLLLTKTYKKAGVLRNTHEAHISYLKSLSP